MVRLSFIGIPRPPPVADPTPPPAGPADFNKKVMVPLAGMSEGDIERKVEEAVAVGQLMPRGKEDAARTLPSVIE
jgi:hypothetical protein